MLKAKILQAATNSGQTYVDDVFSTYLYTGNGSTQTINNGIDLAGKGGLIWIKDRVNATSHALFDTSRGVNLGLTSNDTSGSAILVGSLTSFNSSGFSLGSQNAVNNATGGFASWTFRKAPKFFDVVTWTGDGTSNRAIAHSLGVDTGMVLVKATSTAGSWIARHRSATGELYLEQTAGQAASFTQITATSASTFSVSGAANTNGVTYVAYPFAHDASADGIIQCGSFTTDASGNATVTLGWEPQLALVKRTDSTSGWITLDCMRGWPNGANATYLMSNSSSAETADSNFGSPTSTGFSFKTSGVQTYIYFAIRRPNKPPTSGTQVYSGITSTAAADTKLTTGFPVDMQIQRKQYTLNTLYAFHVLDRLRGVSSKTTDSGAYLLSSSTAAEATTDAPTRGFDNVGFLVSAYNKGDAQIYWNFRRAPGFFDVVCDTGTGAAHSVAHSLTVAPELVIRKSRSTATQWEVWHSSLAATEKLVLNSTAAKATDATAWNSTLPTASALSVGTGVNVNTSSATYVTYLFASLPGVSKVGNYTGNGTSQVIACGFTTGARFILIKRADNTGDWYVWDSARGIISGNDPHLSLNTTAAEVTTDDSVDPDNSGFIVNQLAATNINVNLATYIFLAVA